MAKKELTDDPEGVDVFMAGFEHAQKPAFVRLRQIVLAAAPEVTEGIKWNVPSFYKDGWFATFHTRTADAALILHRGAKVRGDTLAPETIEDPEGLLKWLGKDRAMVAFKDAAAVEAKAADLEILLKSWIRALYSGNQ